MEEVVFSNEEKERLNEWSVLRSKALLGDKSAEDALKKIPTVAGRPAWVSLKYAGLVLASKPTEQKGKA